MLLRPDPAWTPAFWTDPGEIDTRDGDLCIQIADIAFATQPTPMRLDDWQRFIIRLALARDPETGKRLYRQVLVSLGRQNGKSTLAVALVLWGLLTRADANVVGIASNVEQANIVYRRALSIINNSPSLKKRFNRMTETRSLGTKEGAVYKVLPSKEGALQGHSMSLVIPDEVHLLSSGAYNATVIGAGQVPDSLVFSITTAGDDSSTLLLDLYARLRDGTPGFGGAIWEADEGARVDDLEQLKKANPALAEGRMDPEQVLQEVGMMPDAEARRYRLNRFIAAENAWLPLGKWAALPTLTDFTARNPVLVLDRTPDWSGATITVAWQHDDMIYTDVVASVVKPEVRTLVDLCAHVYRRFNVPIHMDGLALADVADALKLKGVRTERLSRNDAYTAPAIAYQKIIDGKVTHAHHGIVGQQLNHTIAKSVGDSYRLTRPNTATEVDAALATVMSIYLAETQPEVPIQVF